MSYEPYTTQPYGAPAGYAPQPPEPQQPKGLGIAAMVLGIIAVILAFIPIIGVVSFVLGLAAIGLGIFAIIKRKGKGQGIAGIITGAVALLVATLVTLFTSAVVTVLEEEFENADLYYEDEEILNEIADAINEDSDDDALQSSAPQGYTSVTIVGDESALPEGEAGEVSVVAMSEPESNTSFPFILHNGSDQTISRVEVSGRAVDPDGETLGTGGSHMVNPNVIPPGGYAFGYVYVDSSDFELPDGASIPDLRVDYTEGLDTYENIITLDVDNFEELSNGDLTGDVTNPHDITVRGPMSVETVCLTADERVLYSSTFTDQDSADAGDTLTWTLSTYGDTPDCAVRMLSANGYN